MPMEKYTSTVQKNIELSNARELLLNTRVQEKISSNDNTRTMTNKGCNRASGQRNDGTPYADE